MSLFIWPREAALIGCALQEYLEALKDDDDHDVVGANCFLDFVTKRLGPFFPPIVRLQSVTVQDEDVPADIEWEVDASVRGGFAPSCPESWFSSVTDRDPEVAAALGEEKAAALRFLSRFAVRCTRLDSTARNPLDLIVECVAPHVARSPKDDAAFTLTRADGADVPWGLLQQRAFVHSDSPRIGADDQEAIEAAIVNLASENNCADMLYAGQVVGAVLAECDYWERWLFSMFQWENAERFAALANDWRTRFLPDGLAQIQALPMLDPGGNAATWLQYLAQNLGRPRLDPKKNWDDEVAEEIRKLSTIRNAAWLAFGEILHAAKDAPDGGGASAPRLAARQKLRLVRLTADLTPGEFRARLLHVQEMFEKGDVSEFPEDVILCLGPGIENLTRRVWGESFHGAAKLRAVLQERLRSSDDEERRFASVAMTLYDAYRNPSQHQYELFTCSLNAAMFFFLGMRELFDLSEAIRRGQRRT